MAATRCSALCLFDLQEVTRPSKKEFPFSGAGGAPKLDFGNFLQNRPFYPINKFRKVAHEVRATRDIIFHQGSEPIRPYIKVPKKHKIMSDGTSYHDTPLSWVPWYPGTMPPRVPWVPLVPYLPRYHGTKVPWYHNKMNFEPSLGGRRPSYPGGAGDGAPR